MPKKQMKIMKILTERKRENRSFFRGENTWSGSQLCSHRRPYGPCHIDLLASLPSYCAQPGQSVTLLYLQNSQNQCWEMGRSDGNWTWWEGAEERHSGAACIGGRGNGGQPNLDQNFGQIWQPGGYWLSQLWSSTSCQAKADEYENQPREERIQSSRGRQSPFPGPPPRCPPPRHCRTPATLAVRSLARERTPRPRVSWTPRRRMIRGGAGPDGCRDGANGLPWQGRLWWPWKCLTGGVVGWR
jgi:hypothetical protein